MSAVTAAALLIAAALYTAGALSGLAAGYLAARSTLREYETTTRLLREERDTAEAIVVAAEQAGYIRSDQPRGRHER